MSARAEVFYRLVFDGSVEWARVEVWPSGIVSTEYHLSDEARHHLTSSGRIPPAAPWPTPFRRSR